MMGQFIQCEAPKIAKLVNITPITMVYGTYNYRAYKPTYNWGASHCRKPLYLMEKKHGFLWVFPWTNPLIDGTIPNIILLLIMVQVAATNARDTFCWFWPPKKSMWTAKSRWFWAHMGWQPHPLTSIQDPHQIVWVLGLNSTALTVLIRPGFTGLVEGKILTGNHCF